MHAWLLWRSIALFSFASILLGCAPSASNPQRESAPAPLPASAPPPKAESGEGVTEGGSHPWNIVTWGRNTPEWNARLKVNHIELGCSGTPLSCVQAVADFSAEQAIDQWTISMSADAAHVSSYALEYSKASLTEPRIVAISIDDFILSYQRWRSAGHSADQLLREVLAQIKSANPRLLFGVTVYEDELSMPAMLELPADIRDGIDRVTLYAHYRANESNFDAYVAMARTLFPKARIWAGSYAYDRIDYLACSQQRTGKCTAEEQRALFSISIETQARMLRDGAVDAIEFYAATFGYEDTWAPWGRADICRPERRAECVANTKELHQIAADTLDRYRPKAP